MGVMSPCEMLGCASAATVTAQVGCGHDHGMGRSTTTMLCDACLRALYEMGAVDSYAPLDGDPPAAPIDLSWVLLMALVGAGTWGGLGLLVWLVERLARKLGAP